MWQGRAGQWSAAEGSRWRPGRSPLRPRSAICRKLEEREEEALPRTAAEAIPQRREGEHF